MDKAFLNSYRISYKTPDGARLTVSAMTRADIEDIAEAYLDVHINEDNYRERLSPDSDSSFAKRGGMFNALTKAEISDLCESGDDIVLVMKRDGQFIAASWLGVADPHFPDMSVIAAKPECGELVGELERRRMAGRMFFSRDVIVKQGSGVKHALVYLVHAIHSAMFALGYNCSVGEIYKVLSYKDGEGTHCCNLLNERSLNATLSSGCVSLGNTRRLTVRIGTVEAEIEPLAFGWLIDETLPKTLLALNALGAIIIGKDGERDG